MPLPNCGVVWGLSPNVCIVARDNTSESWLRQLDPKFEERKKASVALIIARLTRAAVDSGSFPRSGGMR